MNLREHLDALQLENKDIAREAGLSYVTIRYIVDGRPVPKSTANMLLGALSRKYGRKVEPEEVEGLIIGEAQP